MGLRILYKSWTHRQVPLYAGVTPQGSSRKLIPGPGKGWRNDAEGGFCDGEATTTSGQETAAPAGYSDKQRRGKKRAGLGV